MTPRRLTRALVRPLARFLGVKARPFRCVFCGHTLDEEWSPTTYTSEGPAHEACIPATIRTIPGRLEALGVSPETAGLVQSIVLREAAQAATLRRLGVASC